MSIAIPPYFINSPLPTGVTPNLLFSDVWQGTLNVPVIAVNNSLISFYQSGNTAFSTAQYTFGTRITDPTMRFEKFSYAAGTTGVYSLNFTACTPVVNKIYMVTIFGGSATYPYSYSTPVVAATTSATDLATAVYNSLINAQQSAFFTVTNNGSGTLTLSEVATTTGGFTVLLQGDANYVFSTTTPNAQPVGTLAQVQLYKPSVTTGTFNLYQWKYRVLVPNVEGSGQEQLMEMYIQIFIDTAATNYSRADADMVNIGSLDTTYWGGTYSSLLMQNALGVPQ